MIPVSVQPGTIGPAGAVPVEPRDRDRGVGFGDVGVEALEIYRFNFGDRPTSRVLPALFNNLAAVSMERGELDRAEELYSEGEQVVLETLGDEHWMMFHFAGRKAQIRVKRNDPAVEAELRQLVETWQPRFGDHWRIADVHSMLGESLSRQGRCEEAEPLLIESFEKLVAVADANPQRAGYERLAEHFSRCGDASRAEPYAAMLPAAKNSTDS